MKKEGVTSYRPLILACVVKVWKALGGGVIDVKGDNLSAGILSRRVCLHLCVLSCNGDLIPSLPLGHQTQMSECEQYKALNSQ